MVDLNIFLCLSVIVNDLDVDTRLDTIFQRAEASSLPPRFVSLISSTFTLDIDFPD